MPKWEVCEVIKGAQVDGERLVHEAILYGPSGATRIAQSGPFTDPRGQRLQLWALVAQLAMDGWEPIPWGLASSAEGLNWMFKRPV